METFQRSVASRSRGDASSRTQDLRLSNRLVVTNTGAGSSLGSSAGLSLSSSKGVASPWHWKSGTWRVLLLLVPAFFIGQFLFSNRTQEVSSQHLDAEGAENAVGAVDAIGAAGTAPIAAIVAAGGSFASHGRAGGDGDGGGGSLLGVTGSGTGGDDDSADPEQQKQQGSDPQQKQQTQQDEWKRQQRQQRLREGPSGLLLPQMQQQDSDPLPQQQQQQQQPMSTTALIALSSADVASTGAPSATTAETVETAARVHGESPGGESSADHANSDPNAYDNPSAIHANASANGGADRANASGANSAGGAVGESWGSQRFYMVTGEGDYCAGESHWTWSFLCAAAEAKALNRTLIIPMARCLDARHTLSHLTEEKPMVLYYAMDHWPRMQPIMLDLQFELKIGPLNVTILRERYNMSVRVFEAKAPTSRLESEDARNATLIMRRALFAYQMCDEHRSEKRLVRNYNLIQRPMYLRRLAEAIRRSIGGDYDAVHVRRGDKLNRYYWPHVDRDTRPDALLKKLPKFIKPGRHVYIASNERTPGFFSPLASLYKIHVLSDYRHLWAPGSDWYNACWELMQRQRVSFRETGPVFDAQMQWIVDQLILSQARKRVETFPDLTNDKKHASLR